MTEEWKTPNLRKNARSYIYDKLPEHGDDARKKAQGLEKRISRKAGTNKYEYLKLLAKLTIYYQRKAQRNSEQQQQQDQQ